MMLFCSNLVDPQFIAKTGGPLPIETTLYIAREIATGLLFLVTSSPKVYHRDLKSANGRTYSPPYTQEVSSQKFVHLGVSAYHVLANHLCRDLLLLFACSVALSRCC